MKRILGLMFVVAVSLLTAQTVTPSGAFNYTFPIKVPAAAGGLTPAVALSYNSQGGRGNLGKGFNITGFESISRDSSYPINFNDSDHFLFNGQKLIPSSSVPGEYYLENHNFSGIKYNGSYWVVTEKSGIKKYFGSATGKIGVYSSGNDPRVGTPRLWSLDRVEDVHGNFYTIEYFTNKGAYYPSKIVYNQHPLLSSVSNNKVIEFLYETKKYSYATYNPSEIIDEYVLKTIAVSAGDTLIRKYDLGYKYEDRIELDHTIFSASGTYPDLVSSITESRSDSTGSLHKMKPVEFTWNDAGFTSYSSKSIGSSFEYTTTGDFNGDGLADLVRMSDVDTGVIVGLSAAEDFAFGFFADLFLTPDSKSQLRDFNNDGMVDVSQTVEDSSSTWLNKIYTTTVAFSDGESFIGDSGFTGKYKLEDKWNDLNGDGKQESYFFKRLTDGSVELKSYFYENNGFKLETYPSALPGGYYLSFDESDSYVPSGSNKLRYLWGNFNSDSEIDLLLFSETDCHMYFNNDGFHTSFDIPRVGSGLNYKTGDFNGDGLTDIINIIQYTYNSIAVVYYADGTGGFVQSSDFLTLESSQDWSVSDFNGDGMDDFVRLTPAIRKVEPASSGGTNTTYTESRTTLYLSAGGSFTSAKNNFARLGYHYNIQGDFNGDGLIDIVRKGSGSASGYDDETYYYLKNRNVKNMIVSVKLPSGRVITPVYTPAAQHQGAIISKGQHNPVVADKTPRHLVTEMTIDDGFNQPQTTKWQYYNGKSITGYSHEKQNLGFEWIRTIRPDGYEVKTWYYQENTSVDSAGNTVVTVPPYAGAVKKTETLEPSTITESIILGSITKTTYTEGEVIKSSESIYTSHPIQSSSADYKAVSAVLKTEDTVTDLSGMETGVKKISYSYDSFGNLIQTLNHGDLAFSGDESLQKTQYRNIPGTVMYLPEVSESYSYALNGSSTGPLEADHNLASRTEFLYDSAEPLRGLLKEKRSFSEYSSLNPAAGKFVSEGFEYDAFGNISAVLSGNSRTELSYDSFQTLLTESVVVADPAASENNHKTVTEYNSLLQKVKTTDINGNALFFEYGPYGREIAVYQDAIVAGNMVSRTYFSDIEAPSAFPLWVKTETLSNESSGIQDYITSVVYTDAAGKQIQTRTQFIDENGTLSWAVTNYKGNPVKRTERVSEPFAGIGEAFSMTDWNKTHRETVQEKDPLGRVISVKSPDGMSVYSHYGDKEVLTVTTDGSSMSCSLDQRVGRSLVNKSYMEVSFAGTNSQDYINYFYTYLKYSWEYKTTTTKAFDGEVINEIILADEGIRSGNTIRVHNDLLGRKLSYDDMDKGLWTYSYNPEGTLQTQTDANGNTVDFEYDSLNRVSRKTVKKPGDTIGVVTEYYYDGNPVSADDITDYGVSAKGQLTFLKRLSDNYSESYYYNNVARTYRVTKTIEGKSRTYENTLYKNGSIKEETLPQGGKVQYQYNRGGALTSVTGEGVSATDFKYDIFGKIRSYSLGNQVNTVYSYNNKNYLENINITASGSLIADMGFQYTSYGEIFHKGFSDGYYSFREDYTYDGLGRLVSAVSQGLYGNKNYKYDGYNNILEKDGNLYDYSSAVPHAHAVTSVETPDRSQVLKRFSYDLNGNLIHQSGLSSVVIRAKGSGSATNPPKMHLTFNGNLLTEKTWIVKNSEIKDFIWHGHIPVDSTGASSVDIVFPDSSSSSLTVESISVNGITVWSDSSQVLYDTGSYSTGECFDNLGINPVKSEMTEAGAMRFQLTKELMETMNSDRTYIYDGENRLREVKNYVGTMASFGYDDNGQRIFKSEGNRITYYFFPGHEETFSYNESGVLSSDPAETVSYYFAENTRIAQKSVKNSDVNGTVTTTTEILYYHSDHLGSAVRLTDETGQVVQSVAYDPFGKVVYEQRKDDGSSVSRKYTGQEADESTGLYYYNARYYDPDLGRFIQADILLDGMNRYTYCGNNPVRYVDPTGYHKKDHDDNWVPVENPFTGKYEATEEQRKQHPGDWVGDVDYSDVPEAQLEYNESTEVKNDSDENRTPQNVLVEYLNTDFTEEDDIVRQNALKWALENFGNKTYGEEGSVDNYSTGQSKCNKFVMDAFMKGAGVDFPRNKEFWFYRSDSALPANTFASGADIKNFPRVHMMMPGDILSSWGSVSGHMMIYLGGDKVIQGGTQAVSISSLIQYDSIRRYSHE